MRLCSLIIVSVFLLTACGSSAVSEAERKPKIPPAKASALDYHNSAPSLNIDDMEKLLEEIDKDIDRPNIIEEDIRRGWYYGKETDKKYGTPSSWIWAYDGKESRWISPNIIEESDYEEEKSLCDETAGTYIVSCIDTEVLNCEYIPETECRCIEGSGWVDMEGCILMNEKEDDDEDGDEYQSITQDELTQGWYLGLPNEKKLNTPSAWIWVEAGKDSRWQNPTPK